MHLSSIKVKSSQAFNKYISRKKVHKAIFYTGAKKNIGDSMVPWLINSISGSDFQYSNPLEASGSHLFSVGSILQYANKDCFVWGSGFISCNSKYKSLPKSISAVRGPLTACRVEQLSGNKPSIFGDPALITPNLIDGSIIENLAAKKENAKIGLIPHYVDKIQLEQTKIYHENSVKVIDVETDDIYDFVAELHTVDIVVSSSLHGIILAESFGIPAVWAKFSNRVYGNDFKFHDYYLSTGRPMITHQSYLDITSSTLKPNQRISDSLLTSITDSLIEVYPGEFK
ncbi:polysaccharide pyruvyl transferase family protein [Shewanella gelidii]|nr:polysaccharide pyruvyl transferase family protein [Shewanella gelidii]MCL1096428.1 polysaccharide pyruvyl transferase family protein [Shewanella gelidii]